MIVNDCLICRIPLPYTYCLNCLFHLSEKMRSWDLGCTSFASAPGCLEFASMGELGRYRWLVRGNRVGLSVDRGSAGHGSTAIHSSCGRHTCQVRKEWLLRIETNCLPHRDFVQQFGEVESEIGQRTLSLPTWKSLSRTLCF